MATLEPKMFTVTWTRNYYQLGSSNQNVLVVVQSSIQHHHIQNPFFIFIFSKKKFCWHDITEICWIWDAIDRRSLINVSNTFEELPNSNSFFFHILFFIFKIQLSVLLLFLCTEKVAPIFQGFHVNTKILEILI